MSPLCLCGLVLAGWGEVFLVPPDLQGEDAVGSVQPVAHVADSLPAALLVEASGSLIADGTGEPCGGDAAGCKASLPVGQQRRGNACPPGTR